MEITLYVCVCVSSLISAFSPLSSLMGVILKSHLYSFTHPFAFYTLRLFPQLFHTHFSHPHLAVK